MQSSGLKPLAIAGLILGISFSALAAKVPAVQNRVDDPDAPLTATDTDCSVEKKKIATACKPDPCTPACIRAHKAKKACRIANHILGPVETMDEKKAECNTSQPDDTDNMPYASPVAPER